VVWTGAQLENGGDAMVGINSFTFVPVLAAGMYGKSEWLGATTAIEDEMIYSGAL